MEEDFINEYCPTLTDVHYLLLHDMGVKNLLQFITHDRWEVQSQAKILPRDYQGIKEEIKIMLNPSGTRISVPRAYFPPKYLKSGFKEFDDLLGGGVIPGEIIEIYGKTNTGKTEFCHQILANIIFNAKKLGTALYFDFKNEFRPKRMLHLCDGYSSALTRARVLKGDSFERVFKTLNQLSYEFSKGDTLFQSNLRILIFDGLPFAFYPISLEDGKEWRIAQERFVCLLKQWAYYYGFIIILVNQAVTIYDWTPGRKYTKSFGLKPALGNYWSDVPNFRFLFTKIGKKSKFKAILKKSTRDSNERDADFTISEEGLSFS